MVGNNASDRKVSYYKVVMLDLVVENIIFTQQCSLLLLTDPIILGSNILETHFAMPDIGDSTITLHFADYILTTSLTHDPVHD